LVSSKARKSLDANVKDIGTLLALHAMVGGTAKGRRYGLEVLNKSAIVLITAYWEAYCEDIAAEALAHIVKHARSSDALPNELKRQLAKELKDALHELEVWKIADRGWKKYLSERLERLKEKRNWDFNTPKTEQIDRLFLQAIGITKISSSWKWPKKMTVKRATEKLDKYVTLRGTIAHRGKDSTSVKKAQAEDYLGFVQRLAGKTGGAVNSHVKGITRKALW
jgi:RiboL-PSP-HEPN